MPLVRDNFNLRVVCTVLAVIVSFLLLETGWVFGAISGGRYTSQIYIVETEGEVHSYTAYLYKTILSNGFIQHEEKKDISEYIAPIYTEDKHVEGVEVINPIAGLNNSMVMTPVGNLPTKDLGKDKFASYKDAKKAAESIYNKSSISPLIGQILAYASKNKVQQAHVILVYKCHVNNKPISVIECLSIPLSKVAGSSQSGITSPVQYVKRTSGFVISNGSPSIIRITYVSDNVTKDLLNLPDGEKIVQSMKDRGLLGHLVIQEVSLSGTVLKTLVDTHTDAYSIPAGSADKDYRKYISKIISDNKNIISKINPILITVNYVDSVAPAIKNPTGPNPQLDVNMVCGRKTIYMRQGGGQASLYPSTVLSTVTVGEDPCAVDDTLSYWWYHGLPFNPYCEMAETYFTHPSIASYGGRIGFLIPSPVIYGGKIYQGKIPLVSFYGPSQSITASEVSQEVRKAAQQENWPYVFSDSIRRVSTKISHCYYYCPHGAISVGKGTIDGIPVNTQQPAYVTVGYITNPDGYPSTQYGIEIWNNHIRSWQEGLGIGNSRITVFGNWIPIDAYGGGSYGTGIISATTTWTVSYKVGGEVDKYIVPCPLVKTPENTYAMQRVGVYQLQYNLGALGINLGETKTYQASRTALAQLSKIIGTENVQNIENSPTLRDLAVAPDGSGNIINVTQGKMSQLYQNADTPWVVVTK